MVAAAFQVNWRSRERRVSLRCHHLRACVCHGLRPQMQAFARLASDHLWLCDSCDRDDEWSDGVPGSLR